MGGINAGCCNVSTAEKRATADAKSKSLNSPAAVRSVIELQGVKALSEFKKVYDDKGPLEKGKKKLTTVVARDTLGQYICRKLSLTDVPCNSSSERVRHLQLLASVEHPHICKFVEAFEDKDNIYMVYEKADPTTLFDHVRTRRSLTEEEAADYVRQVTSALAVAHSQGVVHGRLSPRSLILTQGFLEAEEDGCEVQIKICDLGQAYILRRGVMDEEDSSEKAQELEKYAFCPEMALKDLVSTRGSGTPPQGAEKADMWALGVIVYHMLSGRLPFKSANRAELESAITRTFVNFESDMWKKLSPDAQDAVSLLLTLNAGIRLSASSLLRHPWIKVAKVSFPRSRMEQLLANMQMNVSECEFKKFVLRVIAEHLPPEGKQAAVVETAFRCLDRNGDGVLTVEEMIKGLGKHMDCSSDQLSKLFEQVDRDGSGTLNVNEFTCVTMDQKQTTSLPVLWQAFNAFDKDQSGEITFDEMDKIVKEVEGALLGQEQVAALCNDIRHELEGVGQNGKIDFDQFVYIMMNSKPNREDAIKKGMNRILWGACSVDSYGVRHMPITWSLKGRNPRTARSVYRKKELRKTQRPSARRTAAPAG